MTKTPTKTERKRARTPNNKTTTNFRISDELWSVFQPLLPMQINTHRFGGGRPRVPDRDCADAIFYVLRTGCQWKALDHTDLVPGSTAHDRFQKWEQAEVFLKFWQAGVERFDELQGIDWAWLSMDGAFDSGIPPKLLFIMKHYVLGKGSSFSYTFTEEGSFPYFCEFHYSMTGVIIVVP